MPARTNAPSFASVLARSASPGYSPASSRPGSIQKLLASGGERILVVFGHRLDAPKPLETMKIEQRRIRQLRSGDIANGRKYRLDAARKFLLPFLQHIFHDDPLHVGLRAAQRAGDDRKVARGRIARDQALGDVRERANHDMAPILAEQFGRHRLELACEKKIQEQGLDDI